MKKLVALSLIVILCLLPACGETSEQAENTPVEENTSALTVKHYEKDGILYYSIYKYENYFLFVSTKIGSYLTFLSEIDSTYEIIGCNVTQRYSSMGAEEAYFITFKALDTVE